MNEPVAQDIEPFFAELKWSGETPPLDSGLPMNDGLIALGITSSLFAVAVVGAGICALVTLNHEVGFVLAIGTLIGIGSGTYWLTVHDS